VAIGVLAALALALTVMVARSDMESASTALVRGEGDALFQQLHERLRPPQGPPTEAKLEAALAELEQEGLRFVRVESGAKAIEAGTSTIPYRGVRPEQMLLRGERALLVSPLPPDPLAALPPGGPGPAAGEGPPPLLIVEFRPAVAPLLRSGMNRTTAVAAGAVLVLVAFAALFTTRAVRAGRAAQGEERQRRLAALGQMSSVLAHEIRNPLASLKGHAQLLAEMTAEGTRERAKADVVVGEAQRIEQLTRDLLAFVGEGELARRAVATAALVEGVLAGLEVVRLRTGGGVRARGGAGERDRVRVSLDGAPHALFVDVARLSLAMSNLVRNALQASADGAVDLDVREEKGAVILEVRDRGPGIAPGGEEKIFEPFFTTRVQGTGLGLAVARRAVAQHGGTLRASARDGGGATFRVTLPGAARAG
jgi:two-component system sensor histidine kinase HydH